MAVLEASGHWWSKGKCHVTSGAHGVQAQLKIFILLIFDVLFSFIHTREIRGVKRSKMI